MKVSEHIEGRILSVCVQSKGSVMAGEISSGPLAMFSQTLFRSGTRQGSVKSQGVCRSDHMMLHQHRRVK